jgi:solute carrier family 6 GABA transporter-like protein 1
MGIPGLTLEIAVGQAYRGGPTVAYDHVQKRLKGVGFSLVYNGYMVVLYYVPILAWAMAYFRHSFSSPLPWEGDSENFYMQSVIRNGERTAGTISGGSVQTYTTYAGTGMVPETVGWCAFTWFLVWLCIWRGIGQTGRVVYFTMGFPILMVLVLVGRGASLPNANEGIRYAWATWRSEALADGQIWQDACGQIFFSIGLGMGYFTTYASYNNQFQNAVQDALIICFSNSLIEILCGIAVFGIIGYLGIDPGASESRLGSFDIAFLTLPEGTAQMPGAQFWSAIFFLTLMVLGVSSAFALLDTLISLICDSEFGRKWNRSIVVSVVTVVSFLISLIFCTEFGYYLLDGFDTWLNNFSLVWTVMCEFLGATMIYRYKDVVGLVGWKAYGTWTTSYLLSLILGVAIGQSVHPGVGAGVGFGIFFVGLGVSVALAKKPQQIIRGPPGLWSKNTFLEKIYYLMFYQVRKEASVSLSHGLH